MNFRAIAALALVALLANGKQSTAGEWVGYLVMTRPDGAQAHTLQFNVESKRLCNALNDVSAQTSLVGCPSCKISIETCDKIIPNGLQNVVENKVWRFPYVSKKEDRIWFTGLSFAENSQNCRRLASHLNSSGVAAKCIE